MEMISPEEKQKLVDQLEELKARRPEISKRIAEARELGDLKENADYHAAREDQGVMEARIRQLEERLSKAVVAGAGASVPDDMVFLGATVRLRNVDNEQEMLYRLVGEASGRFSEESSKSPPRRRWAPRSCGRASAKSFASICRAACGASKSSKSWSSSSEHRGAS